MSALYRLIRPFLFRLDAESAHRAVLQSLGLLEAALVRRSPRVAATDSVLAQELWGLHFGHPIGLAAGLDKNAALPHVWAALGFSFAELGTVTALAQPGNPRPRLFRLPADRALINRLGFNNAGAAAVAIALGRRLARQRASIPLGINIGKSKATPLAQAVPDYVASLRALFPYADYVVVNVSSPNTPGLRELQSEAPLEQLLTALQEENRRLALAGKHEPKPLLVKVAPDLNEPELAGVVQVAERRGVAGIIASNTTVQRPTLQAPAALAAEPGGLSGAPLRPLSTAIVRTLYRSSGGRLPIIGVGGIFSAEDAYEKIRAGASLVQVYTGFVYEGPAFPCRLRDGLRSLLQRDGFTNVRAAVGAE